MFFLPRVLVAPQHADEGAGNGWRCGPRCAQPEYRALRLQCCAMIERALLVVNRSAATGHSHAEAVRLKTTMVAQLGRTGDVRIEAVADHSEAASATRRFLDEQDTPVLVIAGGGGGTLRAVIEGICEGSLPGRLPRSEQVQVAALRMGSGNLLAKQFGVPADSEEALKGILTNLNSGRTAPCCV